MGFISLHVVDMSAFPECPECPERLLAVESDFACEVGEIQIRGEFIRVIPDLHPHSGFGHGAFMLSLAYAAPGQAMSDHTSTRIGSIPADGADVDVESPF
ncbi:hypothetical protein ACUXZZ_39030 [Streptomyces graminifolii]|uniref:hypothetical protein n=1 Tax=Streptomyces graminifolii TaxID=1266771 RepID=UPI0040598DC2